MSESKFILDTEECQYILSEVFKRGEKSFVYSTRNYAVGTIKYCINILNVASIKQDKMLVFRNSVLQGHFHDEGGTNSINKWLR